MLKLLEINVKGSKIFTDKRYFSSYYLLAAMGQLVVMYNLYRNVV